MFKFNNPFTFKNKKKGKNLITEGSNVTRPGATVVVTQAQRVGIGIEDYINGVRGAENVDYKRLVTLYDLYSEAYMDPHLFSVVEKRKSGVSGRKIEFRRGGVADDKVNEQLASPWFLRFVEDSLDSLYWGFTLVQFFINEKGWIDYYLVPRKHVDPTLRLIKTRQSDMHGTSFDEYDDLLMIPGKEPLGIFARTTPYVIYKRGAMGDWAQFSEIFGMPTRMYTYDSADPGARQNTLDAASAQGGANVFICPDGTQLTFPEAGNKTGSSDLYAGLTDRCNAEMSKAVLGNTLTTEASDTGTQALGTVHNKAEQVIIRKDSLFLLNLLNYEMTDIFTSLGVNTAGGEFVFVEEEQLTIKDKADLLDKAINTLGLPVSDEYLYEQLKIDRPANYDNLKAEAEAAKIASQNRFAAQLEQPQNRFFVPAPNEEGALGW